MTLWTLKRPWCPGGRCGSGVGSGQGSEVPGPNHLSGSHGTEVQSWRTPATELRRWGDIFLSPQLQSGERQLTHHGRRERQESWQKRQEGQ